MTATQQFPYGDFNKTLAQRQIDANTLLCTGIDLVPEKMPKCLITKPGKNIYQLAHLGNNMARWACVIIDAAAPFTSMFKPQKAYWESFPGGALALQQVVKYIKWKYPHIVVFLDCKRGDIDRTQQQYRIAHFELDGVDGMNFSPYMGEECMSNLFDPENPGRAIVGLCYTSNKTARRVQDVLLKTGEPYWKFIAGEILDWSKKLGTNQNAGLVMAAAYEKEKGTGIIYSDHLKECREKVGDNLWFLIPGVGTQGGAIEQTVEAGYAGPGSMVISSSSEINFAGGVDNADFAKEVAGKAEETRDKMRKALAVVS